MKNNIGSLIKTDRKNLGLTQKELGVELGFTHTYITHVEKGDFPPSAKFLHGMGCIVGGGKYYEIYKEQCAKEWDSYNGGKK